MANKVRYAVVGLGWFAQEAILPAFARAKGAVLAALVSGDPKKLEELGAHYDVSRRVGYEDYDALLRSGDIDAVYIALPNSMHADYAVRAAKAGVHVLCEKPMAVTSPECRSMIDACAEANVRLMIAYRLHFEEANLTLLEWAKQGKIGEPRLFSSTFSMGLDDPDNTRLDRELGGGPLRDIGIYCINAARTLFAAEPLEVSAITGKGIDDRFDQVEQQVGAALRFSEDRLAVFSAGYGLAFGSRYELVGTEGRLVLEPAYSHDKDLVLEHRAADGSREAKKKFRRRDQVAPEISYFSKCVGAGTEPEPSGREGLADVRVIEALMASAERGESVRLEPFRRDAEPDLSQEERVGPHGEPDLVHARAPH